MMRGLAGTFVLGAVAGYGLALTTLPRLPQWTPVVRDLVTIPRSEIVQLQRAADTISQRPDGFRFESETGSVALECPTADLCNLEVPARSVARNDAPAPAAPRPPERRRLTASTGGTIEVGAPDAPNGEMGPESVAPPRAAREVRTIDSELDSLEPRLSVDDQALPIAPPAAKVSRSR